MKRALSLLLLLACAGPRAAGPPPARRDYPGRLVPSEAMGRSFVVRQRLEASHDGRDVPSIEAVLQLHGGLLRLVGLTPMGTRAFVITQKGTAIEAEKLVAQAAPIEPRDVLNDIHRVFFRGLFIRDRFAGKPAPPDGAHTGQDDGEEVRELWRGGRLVERSFTRAGQRGRIGITFDGAGEVVARSVTIDNGWFGYRLRIETLEQQWLPPAAE